jgi:hypothetical protein
MGRGCMYDELLLLLMLLRSVFPQRDAAREPSLCMSADVHDGANRGVMMGVMRGFERAVTCSINSTYSKILTNKKNTPL